MRQLTQPERYGREKAYERGEKKLTAKTDGGGAVGTLVFHVGAQRWIPPELSGRYTRLWEGIRRVLDMSRKRLSGRANG